MRYSEIIEKEKVRFVDVKYVDLLGKLRHVTIPLEKLPSVLESGIGIDGSSLPGFKGHEASDMRIIIDPDSAFLDPLFEEKTLSFLAEIHVAQEKRRFCDDPKFVLEKAARALMDRTGAAEIVFQPELEFYLFVAFDYDEGACSAYYLLEPLEEKGYYGAYHAAVPTDLTADLRNELSALLSNIGIGVKYHHHEGGAYSQVEIELEPGPVPKAADWIILAKYLIKGTALKKNLFATFMPKPIHNEPGSGLHLHHYILGSGGRSLFADENDPLGLSKLAKHYIGGLFYHIRSLTAFTNPSTNSFRRLRTGFESPAKVDFSVADRTSAIRIPGYVSKRSSRIEYRVPDATCNPYLAMAAILMAGLDGIENEIDPEEAKKKAGSIPRTLQETLDALKEDNGYLKKQGVFSDRLLNNWIEIKEREVQEVESRVHPFEFKLYFDS